MNVLNNIYAQARTTGVHRGVTYAPGHIRELLSLQNNHALEIKTMTKYFRRLTVFFSSLTSSMSLTTKYVEPRWSEKSNKSKENNELVIIIILLFPRQPGSKMMCPFWEPWTLTKSMLLLHFVNTIKSILNSFFSPLQKKA